jgi:hypothetical protein
MTRTRTITWYDIPAGTKPAECKGCSAEIYFIPSTVSPGISIPISVEPDGAFGPTETEPGRGVSHFTDCPNAGQFGKGKKQ